MGRRRNTECPFLLGSRWYTGASLIWKYFNTSRRSSFLRFFKIYVLNYHKILKLVLWHVLSVNTLVYKKTRERSAFLRNWEKLMLIDQSFISSHRKAKVVCSLCSVFYLWEKVSTQMLYLYSYLYIILWVKVESSTIKFSTNFKTSIL